jgi:hypothetical protein
MRSGLWPDAAPGRGPAQGGDTSMFGRSRTPEPAIIIERWFLSGCYRKAELSAQGVDFGL